MGRRYLALLKLSALYQSQHFELLNCVFVLKALIQQLAWFKRGKKALLNSSAINLPSSKESSVLPGLIQVGLPSNAAFTTTNFYFKKRLKISHHIVPSQSNAMLRTPLLSWSLLVL